MSNVKILFIFLVVINSYNCKSQSLSSYTPAEKEYLNLFDAYRSHIDTCISKNVNVLDTVEMKKVLLNYIYANVRLDTMNTRQFNIRELSDQQMKSFKDQFMSFYRFLAERQRDEIVKHLTAIPVRLSKDKCIYDKLTAFQKQNTFIYFDDRHPEKVLGYMLFIPRIKDVMSAPRIWSWILLFKSGFWAFKAVTGEEGMEYFLSEGIKGPEKPIEQM